MTTELAPVVLFVFNRPARTGALLDSLARCDLAKQSHLVVFSDGPRRAADMEAIAAVRRAVDAASGAFASVTRHDSAVNRGLANSIIGGVTEVIGRSGRVIVLEDDLVLGRGFLDFMNRALEAYAKAPHILSVTGYNYRFPIPRSYRLPVYLSPRSSSWGWGTWREKWALADWEVRDFDSFLLDREATRRFRQGGDDLLPMLVDQRAGRNNSWSIRFVYTHSKHRAYCVHPVRSMVANRGFDSSGVHCADTMPAIFASELSEERAPELPASLEPSEAVLAGLRWHLNRAFSGRLHWRLRRRLEGILGRIGIGR